MPQRPRCTWFKAGRPTPDIVSDGLVQEKGEKGASRKERDERKGDDGLESQGQLGEAITIIPECISAGMIGKAYLSPFDIAVVLFDMVTRVRLNEFRRCLPRGRDLRQVISLTF